MIFDILTIFPGICEAYYQASILGRAIKAGLIQVRATDIRAYASDRHHTVDDAPYGGGDGMVMMAGPVVAALEDLPKEPAGPVIMLTPQGQPLTQDLVRQLAGHPRLILICGRYEGIDERVSLLKVDREISVGDFVLSGGELPALCLVDAVSRLLPGVLGGADSARDDSFMDGLLEYPHYTRPAEFRGLSVPPVLISGDHGAVARWRRKESLRRTWQRRPELLARVSLGPADQELLEEVRREENN